MQHVHAVLIGILFFAITSSATNAATPKFNPQTIDKIEIGYGVDVGDVDGDGKLDLLLADKKYFVWYKNPGKAGAEWEKHVMAANLTIRDNVCITAADINGDGKVEVAVGAMWNPGETNKPELSGSVHYLIRPKDPTKKWKPVTLHHEPTIHRMRWIELFHLNKWCLVVLPLHGRGNKGGQGRGVNIFAYEVPADPNGEWKKHLIDQSLHMTHNMDVVRPAGLPFDSIVVAGREGLKMGGSSDGKKWSLDTFPIPVSAKGAGEVRAKITFKDMTVATIEPMHGNSVVLYRATKASPEPTRTVLIDTFNQGHALAVADVLGTGRPQVIAGWRNPNKERKVGIKLFELENELGTKFKTHIVDDNKMACEDLKVADLDGDGKPEIIAAGRATKNLVIYWNKSTK